MFYMPVSHDYFNGVMLGLYSKRALFIDKPLVVIGGYHSQPYCFFSNKFGYFGMDFSNAKILLSKYSSTLPDLKRRLEKYWHLPYFSNNILKQTLLTLDQLEKRDERKYKEFISLLLDNQDKIVAFLEERVVHGYCICRELGDPVDHKIEMVIAASRVKRKNLVGNVKDNVKRLLVELNKNQNSVISRILCFIHNHVSRHSNWYYYSDLKDIRKINLK